MNENHPCYQDKKPNKRLGRIHIPIAEKCCVECTYCSFSFDGNISNKGTPGSAERVLKDTKSMDLFLKEAFKEYPDIKIIGICGPGDTCASPGSVIKLANLVREKYPNKILCMCTNGLQLHELAEANVLSSFGYVTITINTLMPSKIPSLYKSYDLNIVKNENEFVERQLSAIKLCDDSGVKVKVNTVFLPNVNEDELLDLFYLTSKQGVLIHNLIPLTHKDDDESYQQKYRVARGRLAKKGFKLLHKCKRCRSDECGYL